MVERIFDEVLIRDPCGGDVPLGFDVKHELCDEGKTLNHSHIVRCSQRVVLHAMEWSDRCHDTPGRRSGGLLLRT